MRYIDYRDRYQCFTGLLLYFLIYGEEEPPLEDLEIIEKCVSDISEEEVKRTLQEAGEVLELEAFPEGWICDIAGRGPKLLFDTTKAWIRWVVEKFEEEARRVGKF